MTFDLGKIVSSWGMVWDTGVVDGYDAYSHTYYDYWPDRTTDVIVFNLGLYLNKKHPATEWTKDYVEKTFGLKKALSDALNRMDEQSFMDAATKAHWDACENCLEWLKDESEGGIVSYEIRWKDCDKHANTPVDIVFDVDKALGKIVYNINAEGVFDIPTVKALRESIKDKCTKIEALESHTHYLTSGNVLKGIISPPRSLTDYEIRDNGNIDKESAREILEEAIGEWQDGYEEAKKQEAKRLRDKADEIENQNI
jgi:hypothetical protein